MDNPPSTTSPSESDEDNDDTEKDPIGGYSEREAVELAQGLLDSGLIMNIDDVISRSSSPHSATWQQYPDLVVVSLNNSNTGPSHSTLTQMENNHEGEPNLGQSLTLTDQAFHFTSHAATGSASSSFIVQAEIHKSRFNNEHMGHSSQTVSLSPASTSRDNIQNEDGEIANIKGSDTGQQSSSGINSKQLHHDHYNDEANNNLLRSFVPEPESSQFSADRNIDVQATPHVIGEITSSSKKEEDSRTSSQSLSPESSSLTNSHMSVFKNVDNEFYNFHIVLDNDMPLYIRSKDEPVATGSNRMLENEHLLTGPVQKCVDNKINSEFIWDILNCRSKTDKRAASLCKKIRLEEMKSLYHVLPNFSH